jgi:hypothetical protein
MEGGILLCEDQVAIVDFMPDDFIKGVYFISLSSNSISWQAMPDKIVDVRPTLAGGTVAVIADGFHTIYGLSKATGEILWQKETGSRLLESDGKYFYILTEDEGTLQALDPASGNVAWSRRLPYPKSSFYSYNVHGRRLYSATVVVDLSKKAIVHRWPEEPIVNALAFGEHGEILTGDEFGVVRIYNRDFKLLRRIRTGGKAIDELATAGGLVLVSSVDPRPRVNRARFAVFTRQGKKKWQLAWEVGYPAYAINFTAVHPNVVLMEPDMPKNNAWLTSRRLSTGHINWKTDKGGLGLSTALCGTTTYVNDGMQIRGFDLRSGAQTTLVK